MKKIIIILLLLIVFTGCTEEKKINVNQINTGYNIKDVVTIDNIPVNTSIWANVNVDEKFIAIIKYDEYDEIIGYTVYDTNYNNVSELSVNEPPEYEHEEYGWLIIPTSEYNVFYKVILDNESLMNHYMYYIEKNGHFTLLHENYQSAIQIDEYSHSYLYEVEDVAYLIKKDNDELVINEISSNNLIEIKRFTTKYDKYELVDYYYDNDDLVMNYTSEEDNLLIIGDEEYHLELYSKYIIFDDIILVSVYENSSNGSNQKIANSYVIDRNTKEHYSLDVTIDTKYWKNFNDSYYAYDTSGNLIFLTYDGEINIITTTINRHSVDKQKIVDIKNRGIFVLNQDYEEECITIQFVTLE